MVNQVRNLISQLPPLFLGFVVIVVFLIAYRMYEPPVSLCDVQMQSVNENLKEGFLINPHKSKYERDIQYAYDFCLKTNSAGGCSDVLRRYNYFEKQIRNIPSSCGEEAATVPIRNITEKGMRLFLRLAWGEKPPENRYTITGWLDDKDLGTFCRLQHQYRRLFKGQSVEAFIHREVPRLPGAKELSPKDLRVRHLFNHPCRAYL